MTSKNRIFSILSTILVGLLPAVTAGAAISHETAPLSYSRNSGLAGAAANNLMLFGGAYVSGDHHDAVDIYNVQQDTWSTTTLSVGRYDVGAAAVSGKIYFGGGREGGTLYATVDVYDTATGTWATSALSQARYKICAASAGTRVLFAGGNQYNTQGWSDQQNTVDILDTGTGLWTTAALSQARAGITAVSAGNKAFFAGGYTGMTSPTDPMVASSVVDIYNATDGSWTTVSLSQGRFLLGAAAVGGKVLFAGGSYDNVQVDTVDLYDLATETWSTSALPNARGSITGASTDRYAFFAGGNGKVDVYDSATGGWFAAEDLGTARWVTAVSSGDTIVFAGGNTADIYTVPEPATLGLLAVGAVAMMRRRRR